MRAATDLNQAFFHPHRHSLIEDKTFALPAAVAAFVAAGGRMRAVPIEGPWLDAGTPESLAAARAAFGSDGGQRPR